MKLKISISKTCVQSLNIIHYSLITLLRKILSRHAVGPFLLPSWYLNNTNFLLLSTLVTSIISINNSQTSWLRHVTYLVSLVTIYTYRYMSDIFTTFIPYNLYVYIQTRQHLFHSQHWSMIYVYLLHVLYFQ